jgi:ATP-dependent Clp protease adaptor protein ClpS
MLWPYLVALEQLREWAPSHYNGTHQFVPSWQGQVSRLQLSRGQTVAGDRDMASLTMSKGGGPGDGNGRKTDVITKTRPKTKKPSLYKVLILNDDYTPMEFVVFVLERFFGKGREEATRIMLHVHHKGVGVCGVFTYEVAETKVAQVVDFARQHQHPLQCTMEKE